MDRRDFLKGAAAAGSLAILGGCAARPAHTAIPAGQNGSLARQPDPQLRALAEIALDAARAAGASYADVRIAEHQRQSLRVDELRVEAVDESRDRGFGVRVLAAGSWGFAASPQITAAELARVARLAVASARARSSLGQDRVVLAPTPAHVAVWQTPVRRDPFAVSLPEKIELLLDISREALKVPGVSHCRAGMLLVREHKLFASSEGACIEQTLYRCAPSFTVTSVDRRRGDFRSRSSYAQPRGTGYEYIDEYPFRDEARQAGEDAVALHSARSVTPGPRDLILDPTNLWLTIHESIGHPTELDRALGLEANFAGTSFLTPDLLGRYQLGSELVDVVAEKNVAGNLATCGYDDDGVATGQWPLIRRGLFVDYQVTRDQVHWLGHRASHGCAQAQSWRDVPFQRMPNVHLLPGRRPLSLEDLVAATDDGILIKGTGSYSIDHQRYNFQFSGQTFYEIKGGQIRGMLRDVAYQARTPDFWRACDALGGPDSVVIGGSFDDGKGEPSQSNAVSHGCPPARFRQIQVLNTGAA